jgi:hypothetical protein
MKSLTHTICPSRKRSSSQVYDSQNNTPNMQMQVEPTQQYTSFKSALNYLQHVQSHDEQDSVISPYFNKGQTESSQDNKGYSPE